MEKEYDYMAHRLSAGTHLEFKRGDTFVVCSTSSLNKEYIGSLVYLFYQDGTVCPMFIDRENQKGYWNWSSLAPTQDTLRRVERRKHWKSQITAKWEDEMTEKEKGIIFDHRKYKVTHDGDRLEWSAKDEYDKWYIDDLEDAKGRHVFGQDAGWWEFKSGKIQEISTLHGLMVVVCEKASFKLNGDPNFDYFSKIEQQPSNKYDNGKPRLDLVPPGIIEAVGVVRTYGIGKYGDSESWKTVEPSRYRAAMMRHLCAYLRDPQSKDEESGISHLAHLACNVAFLIELEKGEMKDG